jgi:hypothetical protein
MHEYFDIPHESSLLRLLLEFVYRFWNAIDCVSIV